MPSDLPILDELRADLERAFDAAEAPVPRGPAAGAADAPVPRRRGRFPRGPAAGAAGSSARRRWALPAAGGLVLAGAAAVAIALVSGAGSGHVLPASARAAEALERVAAVARTAPAPVPRDDQYYYVRSQGANLSMFAGEDPNHEHAAFLVTSERESWTSVDRPGAVRAKTTGTQPLTEADRLREPSPDGPAGPGGTGLRPVGAQGDYSIGGEKLSRAELLAFPTDPKTIHDRLLANTGNRGTSPEAEVFVEIGDALRATPAPAALRAGLYGALAHVPNVQLLGPVTDRAGRSGLAVALTDRGVRHELTFDPETSELLAERDVTLAGNPSIDAPPGTVIEDVVYLQRAVTDDLVRPPAR